MTASQDEKPWWYQDLTDRVTVSNEDAASNEDDQGAIADAGSDSDSDSDSDPFTAVTSEAIRLAITVTEWAEKSGLSNAMARIAEQTVSGVRAAASQAITAPPDVASEGPRKAFSFGSTHSSTCDYCPICQGMGAMREVSPEVAAGLTDALSAVTSAVRQALDGISPQGSSEPSAPPSRVEHIDLD